jgi:hypothetical protein
MTMPMLKIGNRTPKTAMRKTHQFLRGMKFQDYGFDPDGPMIDDTYGILCEARSEGRVVTLPLGELDDVKGNANRRSRKNGCGASKRKPKGKMTSAEKRALRERKEKYMTIFTNGKQKSVPRPQQIEGMDVDEFIARNADPIWLHQNGMWEYMTLSDGD